MDYEVAPLQAKQSFAEAIALRPQQVEVAKEYEMLRHQSLQAGVDTPEDAWEASFDRWEYELKLVQEKQGLQGMQIRRRKGSFPHLDSGSSGGRVDGRFTTGASKTKIFGTIELSQNW